jgi:hypothetical protein
MKKKKKEGGEDEEKKTKKWVDVTANIQRLRLVHA